MLKYSPALIAQRKAIFCFSSLVYKPTSKIYTMCAISKYLLVYGKLLDLRVFYKGADCFLDVFVLKMLTKVTNLHTFLQDLEVTSSFLDELPGDKNESNKLRQVHCHIMSIKRLISYCWICSLIDQACLCVQGSENKSVDNSEFHVKL